MGQADYQRVLDEMRLADGTLFPIPVTLPVDRPDDDRSWTSEIALRNDKNELLAVMTVEEIYAWDRDEVAQKVFGTQDLRHPAGGRDAPLGQAQHLRPAAGAATAQALRLSRPAPDAGPDARPAGRSSATPTSSPSRPATRCTASTRN